MMQASSGCDVIFVKHFLKVISFLSLCIMKNLEVVLVCLPIVCQNKTFDYIRDGSMCILGKTGYHKWTYKIYPMIMNDEKE